MRYKMLYKACMILMCITCHEWVVCQPCFGTIKLDQKVVCVQEIVMLTSPVESTEMKDSLNKAGDIKLFYTYFHEPSYNSYKNLFIASEWFGLSESDFNEWHAYVKGRDIRIEGIVRFEDDGITYSSIQYFVIAGGIYDRASFLCKKINNHWYPTSTEDDITYAYEKAFFRRVRPQFLDYLLDENSNVQVRNSSKASLLRSQSVKEGQLDAYPLMLDRHKIESYTSDDFKTLYYNLKELEHPEIISAEDRMNDSKFMQYMDSLQVPDTKQTELLGLIQNFHYLRTATQLAEFQGSTVFIPLHTAALQKIYGNNRLIEIVAKTENE